MPSNPFRVGPSVETARWLPGTFKDAGITHLFNNLISFNERLFFSPWLCTTLFFFLLLCYFHPFPPFGGGGMCFLFLRMQNPLAQQDSVLELSSPPTPAPFPVPSKSPVQTACLGPRCRPLAGDHRAGKEQMSLVRVSLYPRKEDFFFFQFRLGTNLTATWVTENSLGKQRIASVNWWPTPSGPTPSSLLGSVPLLAQKPWLGTPSGKSHLLQTGFKTRNVCLLPFLFFKIS